ncbi:MAG: hypothetical protein AAGA60_10725 [Cyanobacteria bacterium P01_E01_bin.42]
MVQGRMIDGRDYIEFPDPDGFRMPYETPSEWERVFWENRYQKLTNESRSPLWRRFYQGNGRKLYG